MGGFYKPVYANTRLDDVIPSSVPHTLNLTLAIIFVSHKATGIHVAVTSVWMYTVPRGA